MTSVKNIRGTSDTRKSQSLLGEWMEYTGTTRRPHCAVVGCPHAATDGAHVIITESGLKQYIVPMCHSHNMTYDVELVVHGQIMPVVR